MAYLPYAMGRMKFLWGDDADIFRPERWLDKEGVFQPESPFKFTAFQVSNLIKTILTKKKKRLKLLVCGSNFLSLVQSILGMT